MLYLVYDDNKNDDNNNNKKYVLLNSESGQCNFLIFDHVRCCVQNQNWMIFR